LSGGVNVGSFRRNIIRASNEAEIPGIQKSRYSFKTRITLEPLVGNVKGVWYHLMRECV
jgi:hypothetical protein